MVQLRAIDTNHLAETINLYEQAFPENERRPTEEWKKLIETNDDFHVYDIYKNDAFCGFLSYWTFNDFAYIEHFATHSTVRGGGIGSSVLLNLIEQLKELPVVLEVELPTDELKQRRIGFYERNGFTLLNKPYTQPPYRKGEPSFPLLLMTTNEQYVSNNWEFVVRAIHKHVYNVENC